MAATNTGMFNFDDIMEKFYGWTPADTDVAGQALKNTFQGDFLQTVLNNQMSKDLAYTNAEIATGQMTDAAMLELANQTAIMKDEFTYGMEKMGAEYDYQSKFATDEANREINKLGYTADLQQNQTKLEGEQNRLNIEAQGVNDVVLQDQKNKGALDQINSQGNIDTQLQNIKGDQIMDQLKESGLNDQALQELKNAGAIDQIIQSGDVEKAITKMKEAGLLNQIGAQGVEALKQIESQGYLDNALQKMKGDQATAQIGAQGKVDKDLQSLKGDQAIGQITAQGALDNAMQKLKGDQAESQIGAQGSVDKDIQGLKGKQATEQIGAQGNVDLSKITGQGNVDLSKIVGQGNVDLSKIKETGNQERQGMMQATQEDTKKQKRDRGMARGLAGMF